MAERLVTELNYKICHNLGFDFQHSSSYPTNDYYSMRVSSILLGFILLLGVSGCDAPEHQYRIQKDGLYGFIDDRGYETIEPQYRYVGHFTKEGYALVISEMSVSKTGKSYGNFSRSADTLVVTYGYINANNEIVVPFNQVLKVSFPDLKTYWIIDNPTELNEMYNLGELAFTHRVLGELDPVEGKFLYQDTHTKFLGYKAIDGRIICPPQFIYGTHYQNSLAVVVKSSRDLMNGSLENFDVNDFILSAINNKGAIDSRGKIIIPCKYFVLDDFAKDGTTWAASMGFDDDGHDKMSWVRINKEGEIVMGPMGSSMVRYWNSNEDRYLVGLHLADMWFYTYMKDSETFLTDFNHDGTITIASAEDGPAEVFQDATGFRDGFAAVKTDHWYIVDGDFNNLSGPYDSVKVMSGGLIAAKKILRDKDNQPVGNWGYLDKSMSVAIPFDYSDCGNFTNGLAWYEKEEFGSTITGYINKQGKSVWDTQSKAKNNYMTWCILILVAICLIIIFVTSSKNEKLKNHYNSVRDKYPDGVREWRNKTHMSDKDAYRLVDGSIDDIKSLDSAAKERMKTIKAEHERLKGLYPNGYARFTRMHFNPPPKDFQAMEAIISHLESEYQAKHAAEESAKRIKDSSPNGFRIWSRNHTDASIEDIIQNESAIQQAESAYQAQHRAEIERRQREEEERQRLNSLSRSSKTDASAIQQYLRNAGVSYFYHFTDRRNLASIREHGGLFSWKYCEDHGIAIPYTGGSDFSRSLDRSHGLSDYVRLSFCDDHPMAFRLKQDGYDLVLLKIKVDVASIDTTLFSNMNATDSNHHHGGRLADLQQVDISATRADYLSSSDPRFKPHQAEVLVKTFVPLKFIVNIDDPDDMR